MVNSKFGRHDVWISSACLHVEKEGVTIKVKNADETVGTLKVTDTHVAWVPKGKRMGKGISWRRFTELMSSKMKEV